jgi:hypothetical protein
MANQQKQSPGDRAVDQGMAHMRHAIDLAAAILLDAANPALPDDLIKETIMRAIQFVTTNCIISIHTHAIRGGDYLPSDPKREDLLKMAKRVASTLHSAIQDCEQEEKELLATAQAIQFYLERQQKGS